MRLEVTGRHNIEITPAIRSHVENELEKLSTLFQGDAVNAHVVIDVEKNRQKAEIIFFMGDRALTATQSDKDLYQAISKVVSKVEKQALRQKEKRVDRRQSAKKTAEVAPTPDGNIPAAPPQPRIINAQSYSVKPMTAEEAVLALGGEANQFLVFRDAETDRVSVLYKRTDGNFGLIQP